MTLASGENFSEGKRKRPWTPARRWQWERRVLKGVLARFVGFAFRRAVLQGKGLAATPQERARITEACGLVMYVLGSMDGNNGVSKACWLVEYKEKKGV